MTTPTPPNGDSLRKRRQRRAVEASEDLTFAIREAKYVDADELLTELRERITVLRQEEMTKEMHT